MDASLSNRVKSNLS